MQLLANHQHMELWNIMKKLRRLYCVPNKNFSYEYGEFLYRSSQDTYQQKKRNMQVASQIARMQLLVNQVHILDVVTVQVAPSILLHSA